MHTKLLLIGLVFIAILLASMLLHGANGLKNFQNKVKLVSTEDDLMLYQYLITKQMKLAVFTMIIALVGVLTWAFAMPVIASNPKSVWLIPAGIWFVVLFWAFFQRGQEKTIWQTPCNNDELKDKWDRLSHIWRRYP